MLEKLYMILGIFELLIIFILIGKYIFFEKFFFRFQTWCFFFGIFLIGEFVASFLDKEGVIQFSMPFLFFYILIFFSRKKRRIRGLFLILPITGIILSFITIPLFFEYLFSNSMNTILNEDCSWMGIFDVLFWIGILLFFFWKRKNFNKFDEVIKNRTLSKWEGNLINTAGLFLFVLSALLICVDELKITSIYAKFLVGSGIFIIVFLDISIIAMVIQGNGKTYFQQTAILNEHYLKAQLEHFKTYQQAQKETRRVYHDMKNHMACLYNLILEGKNEEAGKYIMDLNVQVQQIDKELHTGNDIVDAIINEKYINSKKDGILFSIDGKLTNLTVEAIDICTIFSNAIDNGIEALKKSSVSEKEIQIQFKQQNTMQFIRFRNPIDQSKRTVSFFTTKKNYISHGFGLGNIRMCVEKYNGQMDFFIEHDGEQNYFVLEIILFLQFTT